MTTVSELVAAAGLTGRGGAEFPTAVKIDAARRHDAELIVNACDGELDARKDGWVVARFLPRVLEGARHLTRQRIRVAAHRDSETLATLQAAGVDTLAVPRRYVSSEESALTQLAHGGAARPLMRFEPIVAGSRTRTGRRLPPTLVLNAETVWRIQQIIEFGPGWFRSYGTPDEPGPRLITVVDGVGAPGVYPGEAGLPVTEILYRAGGLVSPMRALWIGGLGGGFLSGTSARRAAWSRAGLAPYGLRPGAGTIRVLGTQCDPWEEILRAVTYAAGESAGQCGPCMFGLPAVRDDVAAVAAGDRGEALDRLAHRLGQLAGRGACRFPDGIAGFLGSALRTFTEEETRSWP
ncbi:NADH-ubiquinone oxidoreductase-F iron-sulfur binding region domain-containing protein [Nocardia vermiculata]|uniref:NADH-quinone oxidoreductase n=1 Tax=Nocardia vermiculata TaxID=257274 RepID=A0A846XY10_9NOCA|nr:NADH-ubiquinone oxidoreductase-F iron-sulfur binding region domain-containing protein [Nocardia vermiculata]NKY51497.1 NADH-quinone oxidoreductase [Nocardia vermiculata]